MSNINVGESHLLTLVLEERTRITITYLYGLVFCTITMSLISANPIFSKLNQFVKCCSLQLFNKTNNNVISFYATNAASSVNRTIEANPVNKQAEKTLTEAVLKKVNEDQKYNPTRTFAVVQVGGKQFKVTTGDVIIIEGYWPPDVGDKLRLDKVLCAGGVNFSVFGTPLVQHGLVDVQATVIEKTLSHTKTHFRKKRRKQYMNINFYRTPRTMLRINDVGIGQLKETVDEY